MTTIKLKKNSTSGEAPTASDLAVGEVAVNTADGLLYTKHTDNSIKTIGGGASGDLVDDTSPQLGGDLETNGNNIITGGSDVIKLGNSSGNRAEISHTGTATGAFVLNNYGGDFVMRCVDGNSTTRKAFFSFTNTFEDFMIATPNDKVQLNFNNQEKFKTTNTGIDVTGAITVNGSALSTGASAYTINTKTSAYTLVDGDLGKIISFTSGTVAATLPAGSGLATGWYASVWNDGSGVISITPAGSDYIGSSSGNGHNSGDVYALQRGMGVQLVWNGTRWNLKNDKPYDYFKHSTSIGENSAAENNYAVAIGSNTISGGVGSIAIGAGLLGNPTAYGSYGVAIGDSSYNHSTGNRAVSLGQSYSASAGSFAAVIGNNTSSYGATGANSVAIGYLAKATGEHSVALGKQNIASNHWAFVGGGSGNTGSGAWSATFGSGNTNSGAVNFCVGYGSTADGDYGAAIGRTVSQRDQNHTLAFGLANQPWTSGSTPDGSSQTRITGYAKQTADASPLPMNGYTSNHSVNANNSFTLPNNAAATFSLTVIANVTGGGNSKAWKLEGAVKRGASASATALIGSVIKTTVAEDSGAANWDVSIAANTTIGGLVITCTGQASTSIRWVGRMDSTEVTY